MNVRKEATMNWEDAHDTITPEIYAQLRGRSVRWARSKFKEKNFPLIDNGKPIADKTAVKLYDMGIDIKNQPKQGIEFLILLELKKANERYRLEAEISTGN